MNLAIMMRPTLGMGFAELHLLIKEIVMGKNVIYIIVLTLLGIITSALGIRPVASIFVIYNDKRKQVHLAAFWRWNV